MRKSTFITTVALFLLLAMVVGLAQAKVNITVLDAWGPGPWTQGLYQEWSELLAKRLPEVDVEFIMTTQGSSIDKLATMIAAGATPDVSLGSQPEFGVTGHVLDLTPFIERDPVLRRAHFYPSSVDFNTIIKDGRPFMWGIPGNSDSRVLWVNMDLMANAGIDFNPEVPYTWNQFRDIGRKLTRRDSEAQVSQWGFALPLDWPWNFSPYIWTNGGTMLQRNEATGWNDKAIFANDKTIEALDWVVGLLGDIAPPPGVGADFVGGKAAITQSWSSLASWDLPFTREVAPTPVPRAGMTSINVANGSSMGSILKYTKHPNESWEVLKLLAGDEGDCIRVKYMPHPPAVVNSKCMKDWQRQTEIRIDIFLQQIINGRLGEWSKIQYGAGDVGNIVNQEFQKMWRKEVSPREAMMQIDRRANAFFAEMAAK